jgi:hypothetical protein
MPRNITVSFEDGTQHVYENAPDDITPEAVIARASKEFDGVPITNVDGGREPQPEELPSRTGGDIVKDIGVTAGRSGISGLQQVEGLADLLPGVNATKYLSEHGVDLGKAKEYLQENASPQQQQAYKNLTEAKGAGNILSAAIENPSAVAELVGENIIPILTGGAEAKLLTKGVPALAKYAPSIGEGFAQMGQEAQKLTAEAPDKELSGKGELAALGSGALDAVIGRFAGKLVSKAGGTNVEDTLYGTLARDMGEEAARNPSVVKRVLVSTLGEGAEEALQSGQERIWDNYAKGATNLPTLLEGAVDDATLGSILGTVMGGGASAISGKGEQAPAPEVQPEGEVEPTQPTQPTQTYSDRDRKVDMEDGLELAGVNPDDHPELYAELSDPRHYESEETINALDERLKRYKSDEAPVEGEEDIDFASALPKEFDDTAWEAHLEKQREYARQTAPAAEQPQAENVAPETVAPETEPTLNEEGGSFTINGQTATYTKTGELEAGVPLYTVEYPMPDNTVGKQTNVTMADITKMFKQGSQTTEQVAPETEQEVPETEQEVPEPKPSVSTSDAITEHNVESLQPHLTPEMKRLVESGKLTLHDTRDTLPDQTLPENVQGYTSPAGEVHLVANKLTPETLPRVALHEMGVHVGMRGMVGDKVWGDLTSQALTTKGDAFDRARQSVPENTPEHLKGEETLAYLVENAPNLPIVKRAISAVKNWARTTFGAKLDLTEADAHHLAAKALRRESQTATRAPREETAFSVTPNSKLQEQVEKDRQGMRPAAVKKKKGLKERFSKSGENLQRAADVYETQFFSHDAGFINTVRRTLEGMKLDPNLIGKLLDRVSQAQTVSDSSISAEGALCGSLEYDTNTDFFVAVDKADNLVTMRQIIDDAGTEYGWSEEEAHKFFTSYMVAGRLKEKYEKARALKVEANKQTTPAAKAELFKQSREITDTLKLGMTEEECDAAREAYESVDGFVKAEKMWHKVRENTIDVLVKSGLYSKEKADAYMDAAFYTPMYRVMTDKTTSDELEDTFDDMSSGKYKPNISSLIKGMKEQRFKGSNREVFNMMDNMEHWVQISFSRAVRAKKATDMIDTARRYLPEGAVSRVQGTKSNKDDTITCYFHGKKQYWRFDDPLMAVAFRGVPAAPFALKSIGKVSDIMRSGIVLTPTFTLSQLPQDIYDAAFSSGVKNPFKLFTTMLSEFKTTAFSKEDTEAHKALKAIGAVGAKDSLGDSRTLHLYDTVHHTHLSKDKTAWRKFKSSLEKFAMAGDNAIRQAVYVRTMKELEGDPRAKSIAYQRAFDIINFRRRGASAVLEQVRSVTPFMGAAIQAHRAAYQVIAGRGLAYQSSADSKSAHMRLATTSTTMALMAFVYNMLYGGLLGDDEDKDKFNKEDTRFKDTHIMLFGGNSIISIPIRPSVFSLPYITGNHLFQLGIAESENPRQTADAYREAIISAFGIPMLPPVVREGFQQVTNYDFFTNRPIVPERLRKNDPSYQYDDRTSALGKLVGEATSGLPKEAQLSPIKFDHFMKGWFSGVGTAILQTSNMVEVAASDNPSKEHTFREMARMFPSVPGLVPEEFKEQSKSTYYDLREEVEGAHSTYNRLKKEGKLEDARKYKESNKDLLNESVHQKMNHLKTETDKIHATTRKILSNKNLSSEIKAERVRALEAKERRLLSHVQTLYDKVH